MVSGVLGDRARQLCDLDLPFVIALYAREDHLTLARLQTIHH